MGRRLTPILALQSTLPLGLIAMAVVAANAVYLFGVTDPNPALVYSGMGTSLGAHVLPGNYYVDPNVGFTAQALGHLAAQDWLHGHVPWWNPFEGVGSPLAGEMQSAAFFPLVLLDAFSNGQIFFRVSLELIAGWCTYFLVLRFVTSRAAATACGVAFALNGTFAWMFHAPANPVAFAPMLLLGLEQARERPESRFAGWPLIAMAVALGIYAGFPEVAYIDGLLAALWLVLRASELRGRSLARFLGRVASGLACGLLLAAPLIAAFLGYLPYANVGNHNSGFAHTHLDRTVALPDLLLPYVFGPLYGWISHARTDALYTFFAGVGGYLGVSLICLAVLGLFGRPHRRLRLGLGLWVILAVGRTVGIPPATEIINAIPGVKSTAFFRYSPPSVALAVVVLAGLGIDDLARRRSVPRVLLAGAALVVAVAWAGRTALRGALRTVTDAPHTAHLWADWSIAGAALLVVAITVAALLPGRRSRSAVLAGLLCLESVGLFVIPELSAPSAGALDVGVVGFLRSHLGSGRFVSRLGPLRANYGSYWQLSSFAVDDLPTPNAYDRYWNGPADGFAVADSSAAVAIQLVLQHLSVYEDAGVVYVLLPAGTPIPASGQLRVVYTDSLATVVQLPRPAPLMSIATGGCRVSQSSLSAATVNCQGAGQLIYRELYLPGWSATDDGSPVPVRPYDGLFQTVSLHDGLNRVSLVYRPPYARWAELGLLTGFLLLLGGVGLRRRKRAAESSGGVAEPPPLEDFVGVAAGGASPEDGGVTIGVRGLRSEGAQPGEHA